MVVDTSCTLAAVTVEVAESHIAVVDSPGLALAVTHTGSAAVALAIVVVGMEAEEMLQVAEEAEDLADRGKQVSVAVAQADSLVALVTSMGLEELKAQGRQGRAHPEQRQQGARTCSCVLRTILSKVSKRRRVYERKKCG